MGWKKYAALVFVFLCCIQSRASAADPIDKEKACQILHSNLERPKLRSERIVIGHYTDVLTPPQTKTECTNTYDTGVPDPSTCHTEQIGSHDSGIPDPSTCKTSYDSCATHQSLPFGGWTCLPGTSTTCSNFQTPDYATRCSNIIACNTWRTDKKTMECDITFQFKLPNFIENPVEEFIDDSYNTINATRSQVATALPLECAPPSARNSVSPDQDVANVVSAEVQRRVRAILDREVRRWVEDTALQTIAASIPSGGIGGAAAMSTSIASFIYKAHNAVKPILTFANETKDFAEDLGFSTSCGWSDWHQL